MPSRITPASWGRRLTPAQRQKARRQRLKAQQQANQRLTDDGFCEVVDWDAYYRDREAELKVYFPNESPEEIRAMAEAIPRGTLLPKMTPEQIRRMNLKLEQFKWDLEAQLAAHEEWHRNRPAEVCEPYYVDEEKLAELIPQSVSGEPASIDND